MFQREWTVRKFHHVAAAKRSAQLPFPFDDVTTSGPKLLLSASPNTTCMQRLPSLTIGQQLVTIKKLLT